MQLYVKWLVKCRASTDLKLKTDWSYTKPPHLAQYSAAKRRARATTSPTPTLGGTVYARLQAFLKHVQD